MADGVQDIKAVLNNCRVKDSWANTIVSYGVKIEMV